MSVKTGVNPYQGVGAQLGRNIVLFNKASRVASSGENECPTRHVQLSETDEDGEHWKPEISVMHADDRQQVAHWFADPDERAATLEIDLNELEIREVEGVHFTVAKTHVTKYELPKRDKRLKDKSLF